MDEYLKKAIKEQKEFPFLILWKMCFYFQQALIPNFNEKGCSKLANHKRHVRYEPIRNTYRLQITEGQGIDKVTWRISARRLAWFIRTGNLIPRGFGVYVTCSEFHCLSHLTVKNSGEDSGVRNELRRKRERESIKNKGYKTITYTESHTVTHPDQIPEWAKSSIDVEAEEID